MVMRKNISGIVLFFILLAKLGFCTEVKPYTIGNESLGFKDFEIGLIVDPTRELTINDIVKLQDSATLISSRFVISSIKPDYWFILKLHNPTDEMAYQIIGFDEACLEVADFYYFENQGLYYQKNGLQIPLVDRQIQNRWPLEGVMIEPGETKTCYLRMHSNFLITVGIFSETITVFSHQKQLQLKWYWFYFGAALALLIYNFMLFLNVRDRVYLFYVAYVFFLLLWVLLYSGFSLYWFKNIHLHYILHASAPAMATFLTLFTRELLKVRKVSKWIDNILIAIATIYIILTLLIMINIYFFQWLAGYSMFVLLFLLFTGVYCMVNKVPLSRFYVFAMSLYLIGLFMVAAINIDAIPYSLVSRYGFIAGSFFELVMFSLALGYRLKLLVNEKSAYQQKLIATERLMKQDLEIQVQERTNELTMLSEELEMINEELSLQIAEKDKAINALKESETALLISNSSKDKFFSIIAHDLRSPFNSILGFLSILKDDYGDYNDNQRIKMIDLVHSSAQHTFNLLENLLVWSRSQTKRIVFTPTALDINALIQDSIQLVAFQAKKKNINISLMSNESIVVKADEEMIQVVLRNVLSNAIKFTGNDGEIVVSSGLYAQNEGDMAVVSVKDSGVGMDDEVKINVFNLGQNTSLPGTNNEKGTGLGLILCKEFVEIHHGKIWVESIVGKGTTVHFTLPLSS